MVGLALVCLDVGSPWSCFLSGGDEEEETHIWPVELESRLWRLLPRELLQEGILPRLPMLTLMRLRRVCSSWLSLLSSPSFWSLWFHSHPSTPPLLAYLNLPHIPALPLCSNLLSRWRKAYSTRFVPSSSFLPTPNPSPTPARGRWHCISKNCLASGSSFCILSSDGGLLLLESWVYSQLLVYNPLSNACRELPLICDPKFRRSAFMAVNSEVGQYAVIICGRDRGTYLIYESSTQQYKIPAVDRGCNDSLPQAAQTMIGTNFYWFSDGCDDKNFSHVLIYDKQRESLSEICTRWPRKVVLPQPSRIWCSSLGLMAVAFFEGRVGIWHLSSSSWLLIETLPLEAGLVDGDEDRCVILGDYICLSNSHSGRVFLYDMVKKTWEWSCRCPYSIDLVQGFAFEPRPHAEV